MDQELLDCLTIIQHKLSQLQQDISGMRAALYKSTTVVLEPEPIVSTDLSSQKPLTFFDALRAEDVALQTINPQRKV